jgi:cell division protein FtsL
MAKHPRSVKPESRRKQSTQPFSHGHRRATDGPGPATGVPLESRRRLRAPAGTSFLLALAIVALSCIGVVRVRASTRVLELGAEITELTNEQSELLERKRRLSAERAYLRHPEQIERVARDRLDMVPIAPELVQHIRVENSE